MRALHLTTLMIAASLPAAESNCCISSIVADSHGNLYVNGRGSVLKVTPDAQVTDILQPRTRSKPFGSNVMAIDDEDTIYTAAGTRLYKVLPDGSFTVLAGGDKPGWNDGKPGEATFNNIRQLAVDSHHNLYVADFSPTKGYRLRRVTPDGTVTTLTEGKKSIDGIAIDAAGNVIYSSMNESCIRSLSPTGALTVVAGSKGQCGGPHDAKAFKEGPVSEVMLWYPAALAVAKNGDIYFNDEFLRRVIKISNDRVTVVAGNSPIDQNGGFGSVQGGTAPGYRDGQAREALFTNNHALAFDREGNLWIVDRLEAHEGIVRKLSPNGMVSTFLK